MPNSSLGSHDHIADHVCYKNGICFKVFANLLHLLHIQCKTKAWWTLWVLTLPSSEFGVVCNMSKDQTVIP